MATQTERTVVYGAGIVQGIALVTFPAASTILTDPAEYDLSNTQYGFLFIPQVITAIAAALLGAGLGSRFGTKRVYLVGLAPGLVSMTPPDRELVRDRRPVARVRLAASRHCLPGSGIRLHGAGPQHVHRRVQPDRRQPFDPRAQRAARARHRAGTGLRRGVRRPRLLVGHARHVRRPARRAHRREPAPAAAGRGARRPPSAAQAVRDPETVLGLRGLRRPLRHLRDGQRQLVAARHDERARRLDDGRSAGADRVLGDGDAGAGPLRRSRARGSGHVDLPRAAVRARGGVRAHRPLARRRAGARCPRLRARGPRLLSAPAAHDQLRPGGAHRFLGRGRGRRDRLLPARLRHRRLRRRPAPRQRRRAVRPSTPSPRSSQSRWACGRSSSSARRPSPTTLHPQPR